MANADTHMNSLCSEYRCPCHYDLAAAKVRIESLRATLAKAHHTLERLIDGKDPSWQWHEELMLRIEAELKK